MKLNPDLWPSFVKFATAQIVSGDLDPMYPVLKEIYRTRGYDRNTALWHTFLYVTFYDVGSAERAFETYPTPQRVESEKLSGLLTGIERRGFRGNPRAAADHVNAHFDMVGRDLAGVWEKVSSWKSARLRFQALRGGGPWSSYKWADLLKNVHDVPIVADDIGDGSSPTAGPIPGMVRLTGLPWKVCAASQEAQGSLLQESLKAGVPFSGLDQMETALCDFNSLCKGGYYVGHDVDSAMTALDRAGASEDFWEARKKIFPPAYLGEVGGWFGVRRELKSVFKERGEVLVS